MEDAYTGLTDAYDELFPVNPDTPAYLFRCGLQAGDSILDVGCAAGGHPLAFADAGFRATGLDPSAAMIRAARERAAAARIPAARPDPRFEIGGMLDLPRLFPPASQDAITCLGNTLPHLRDDAEIARFLSDSRIILRPRGTLVLQFLNYGKLLAERPAKLPLIRTASWIFERSYVYGDGFVIFRTRLFDTNGREASRGETRLFPVLPVALESLSRAAGYALTALESGWNGEPFAAEFSAQAILRLRAPDGLPR